MMPIALQPITSIFILSMLNCMQMKKRISPHYIYALTILIVTFVVLGFLLFVQRRQVRLKELEVSTRLSERQAQQLKLDSCLKLLESQYHQNFENLKKTRGISEESGLPREDAAYIEEQYARRKDDCYKQFTVPPLFE